MDVALPILIIAVLIVLNGLFVAAEFAIIGVPRSAIERRAQEGNRVARVVRDTLHDPRKQDRYIATAQLGITFASLGLGMYGEHQLAAWIANGLAGLGTERWIAAHTLATVLAIAILTYFHIVIGEMVPKALALQSAEQTVLWVTPPMTWVKRIFLPLVIALNGIGNGILRLMGIRREVSSGHFHTAEELRFVVRESVAGGQLEGTSASVLQELFAFGDRTAGEAMVPRVHITDIPLGSPAAEVARILRADGHTRYPVTAGGDLDEILGVVHARDLLRVLREGRSLERGDVRPAPFVPAALPIDDALAAMRRERCHLLVVMDEQGGTAGLLSVEDIFEEVVGDIDEGGGVPDIYEDATALLHVAGTTLLEEVGERLDRALEHPEVDTVSGLVLALLGRPARVGDEVRYEGVLFRVAAVEGRGVSDCVVTLIGEG